MPVEGEGGWSLPRLRAGGSLQPGSERAGDRGTAPGELSTHRDLELNKGQPMADPYDALPS